eukprot:2566157-Karenia_brevis.AAC.1
MINVRLFGAIEVEIDEDHIMRLAGMLNVIWADEHEMKQAYKEYALKFHPDKLSNSVTDTWTKLTREELDDAFKKLQGYVDDVKKIWNAPARFEQASTNWKKTRRSRRGGWRVRHRNLKQL